MWDPDLDLWVKLRELQETRKGGFVPRAPESGSGLQSAESAGLSCFTHRRWYDGGTAIRVGGNDSCETTGEQGTGLVVRKWGELLGPAASQGIVPGPGWADGRLVHWSCGAIFAPGDTAHQPCCCALLCSAWRLRLLHRGLGKHFVVVFETGSQGAQGDLELAI